MPNPFSTPPRLSRRASLAALGGVTGAALGGDALAQNAPTPAAEAKPGPLRLSDFGAALDGIRPDQAAIQRAIDATEASNPPGGVIRMDNGRLVTTGAIDLKPNVELDFGRALVSLQPRGAYALGIGWAPDAPMTAPVTIRGRSLLLSGENAAAIAIRNGSGAQVLETDIDLTAAGQTGLRIAANDAPLGPYYGLVDNFRVSGNGKPGQRGILLEQKPATGAIAVNRWIFSNIRHLATLDIGVDVQGADGVTFSNVNFESCYGRAARFGYASRTATGAVTGAAGRIGGFASAALAGTKLDPTGAVVVLSGANAGESMIVSTLDPRTGEVVFPAPFPHKFAIGDRFVFTECKCRSVTILNATNEGGGGVDEIGFEFLAGARDCRVELAMTTMVGGAYFRREVEDVSNSIARRMETISYWAELDGKPGTVWLPDGHQGLGRGGSVTHGSCWVDAIYVTGENGSGGTIAVEVFADSVNQGLTARLTPDSPFNGRRIRKVLKANSFVGTSRHLKVKVTKTGTTAPERLRVDIVLGYL